MTPAGQPGGPPGERAAATASANRAAGLGERLAGPAAAARVRFLDEGTTKTVGDLCAEGRGAGRWISSLDRPVCAMVLSNTAACVAALFGAVGVGATLVSVPLPPRGSSPEWYAGFVASVCRQTGAAGLLVDGEHRGLVPDGLGPETRAYDEVLAPMTRCSPATDKGFRLVQFTSGSTEQPRGVVLGERAVLANVDAILSVIDPEAYDTACSWLPLSHDMGLIGMLLAPCLAAPTTSPGGNLCLLRPERFVRSPRTWLVACSEVGATCTAAPDFAFALMSRRATPAGLDLSSLRAAIVGAEPVRATTLTAFADRFAAAGFDDRAFCPAYGLAEAVLAVTMTAASERWRSVEVDGRRLGDGVLAHVARGTGAAIVASGSAVPGAPCRGRPSMPDGDASVPSGSGPRFRSRATRTGPFPWTRTGGSRPAISGSSRMIASSSSAAATT